MDVSKLDPKILPALQAFNERMILMQLGSGMPVFESYLEAFAMMLDNPQWFMLCLCPDPKNPGHTLIDDRMANMDLDQVQAALDVRKRDQGMDKQIEDQLNEIL